MPTSKQISAVLDAVAVGCETSDQVAAITGLSKRHASAYLSQLADAALIIRTHKDALRIAETGRYMHRYSPLRVVE